MTTTQMEDPIQVLGRKIRMCFVEASDGPRVMLFGPMEVEIQKLQQCFLNLSHGYEPVNLEKEEFVAPFGGIGVLARNTETTSSVKQQKVSREGFVRRSDSPVLF